MFKWILKTDSGWLYRTNSDWGPGHLTTDKIEEAILFDSKEEALYYAKNCSWSHNGEGIVPVKVKYIPAQIKLVRGK